MNEERFIGSLLGTFVGDALGMPVEGWSHKRIESEYGVLRRMIDSRLGKGSYTDDTEMMISVAESLIENKGFDGDDMAMRFVENCNVDRGYGAGTLIALNNIRKGLPWNEAGKNIFGKGSFGNGCAMRVAPIALFYYHNMKKLREFAEKSSQITHAHFLGKEGASVQAYAIALAVNECSELNRKRFLESLMSFTKEDGYIAKFEIIERFLEYTPGKEEVVKLLGIDSKAFNSVPTAIYSFLRHYNSFEDAVIFAVNLGGDTDTIGAMTGAIAGAYHGYSRIPKRWLEALENGKKGRDYIIDLGRRLWALSKHSSSSCYTSKHLP